MRRLGLAVLCAILPAIAVAQNKPEPIKREQSKLWLEDVPGIPNPVVAYIYSGWTPNYSAERFYAQAVPRGGQLPRLQVNLAMLAPGFIWMQDSALGEKYVKTWPFFKDRDVKITREHGGGSSGVVTVPFRSKDSDCFAFLIRNVSIGTYEGSSSGAPPSVDGFYCAAPGTTIDADLTLAVLGSIRVTADLSKVRTALVAAPKLPTTPPHIAGSSPTAPAAGANPPARPPSPASSPAAQGDPALVAWTGAPGTRFVTRNGYFQIVRIDSASVITVNAANQSARWTGGIIARRSGTRIDVKPIASLLPLAVGNEAALEEWAENGDRWRHTIRVARTERLTVKDRSYEAFVITVRDQSLGQNQGGLDRTRSFWVSPEAGGILRARSEQHAGPPAPSYNFDVVEIVAPH